MKLLLPLVVLDLETTGVWIEKDKIIEIGMVKTFPDGRVENYLKRINPQIPIPKAVTELTGISDVDVTRSPLFKSVAQEVLDFIRFLEIRLLEKKAANSVLSESSLKKDWLRSEEDAAWQNL